MTAGAQHERGVTDRSGVRVRGRNAMMLWDKMRMWNQRE